MTVVTWLRDRARTTDFPAVTIRPARLARIDRTTAGSPRPETSRCSRSVQLSCPATRTPPTASTGGKAGRDPTAPGITQPWGVMI